MTYRIGIDVGGTFTDFVAEGGPRLVKGKVPSRPGGEATSVIEALQVIAGDTAVPLATLLRETESLVLGTTVVLNTMLEYDGVTTGLITNRGFRDIIELRRGHKESQFDLRLEAPFPIVPRELRRTVTGRIDRDGRVVDELDELEVREEVAFLRRRDVSAIAVCMLFSFVNAAHERRVGEIIAELLPDCHVSLSCEVLPQVREFDRLSTTLVNAYTSPKLGSYIDKLHTWLSEAGFGGSLLIMQSNGGVMDARFSSSRGAEAIFSGPAAGVVAAQAIAMNSGYHNVITADMGGTSYDVCLIHEGQPQLGVDQWVGRYRIALPLLDIHTIGAGGGSIAAVDPGGALRVGPASARAVPGPACYGRGGERPTVTDANLVLGYIDPERALAGGISPDLGAARQAIDRDVATPLALSIEEAAVAIFRIANGDMTNALRYITVSRGRDPRDYALLAYGGAGPVHAVVQASELGMSTVLVPRHASVLSALGALGGDFKVSRVRSLFRDLGDLDLDELNEAYAAMQRDATMLLPTTGRIQVPTVKRFMDLRYEGQVQEVIVPVRSRTQRVTPVNLLSVRKDFDALHEELYAFRRPDAPVELVSVRLEIIVARGGVSLPIRPFESEDPSSAQIGTRLVYFADAGMREARIYEGTDLHAGNVIAGPAVIHEPDTTIVVGIGQEAMLDQAETYVIEIGT